jgi:hypothetical protein
MLRPQAEASPELWLKSALRSRQRHPRSFKVLEMFHFAMLRSA